MFEDYKVLNFTCINAGIEIVEEKIISILKGAANWKITKGDCNQKSIYFPEPPIGTNHPRKFILWEPKEKLGTTIFLSNLSDGWNTLSYILSRKFNIELIEIATSNYEDKNPMYLFHYMKGETERIVRVMVDEKWQFYQAGTPFSFEDQESYKKRIIKQRFNYTMIRDYLLNFGWNIDSDKFWGANTPPICFEENS